MIEGKEVREIKTCCATFYQSDIVRLLLGNVLHPGGLELTGYLGTVVGLGSEDKVLDIACGRGASVMYLAKRFGCHVTGLDYGQDNISAAQNQASLSLKIAISPIGILSKVKFCQQARVSCLSIHMIPPPS